MNVNLIPFSLPSLYIDQHIFDSTYLYEDQWLIFKESKLLVNKDTFQPFQPKKNPPHNNLYMGRFRNFHLHIHDEINEEAPSGAIWADLKGLYGKIDDAYFALAGKAIQLLLWDRTNRFCGRCGNKMKTKQNERAKHCETCGLVAYPKVSPAMMALVIKKNQILLAQGVDFPSGFYSALAGFVDAGENLEHCIQREVFEEVGLEIQNIRYFASQSWPFPNSLMIAFMCDWKSGEIKIDPTEILDAQWFDIDKLPQLPPKLSIARILIDTSVAELKS